MKILVISDVHGKIERLNQLRGIIPTVDVVAICGDLSLRRKQPVAVTFINEIEKIAPAIVAVHGNWDREELHHLLVLKGISVHGKGIRIDGVGFFGVGGARRGLIRMPSDYSDDEMRELLNQGYSEVKDAKCKVLVSHMPPYKILDRTFIGLRGGSRIVTSFLDTNRVHLCLCGHVHEAWGSDYSHGLLTVNPGSLRSGRYAIVNIDIDNDKKVLFGKLSSP